MLDTLIESFYFKILLAGLLGSFIGIERDIHNRGAGFRTHMFVSTGAALFTIVSFEFAERTGHNCDASRIAAQIVSGIGFLGTGAILRIGANIKGLTTAVCIWVAAAIGMTVAIGMYSLAIASTILALFILVIFKKIESHFNRRCHIIFDIKTDSVDKFTEIYNFIEHLPNFKISDFSFQVDNNLYTARIDMAVFSRKQPAELALELADIIKPIASKMCSFSINMGQKA